LTGPATSQQPSNATSPTGTNTSQAARQASQDGRNDSPARNTSGTPGGAPEGGAKPQQSQAEPAQDPGQAQSGPKPADSGARPVQQGPTGEPTTPKSSQAGADQGEPGGKPASSSGQSASPTPSGQKPAQTSPTQGSAAAKSASGAATQGVTANKMGQEPSTPGQEGHKPGVTPRSPSQARSSEGTKPPVTERVSQRVSQAVSAATETVHRAADTRRSEERRPTAASGNRPGSGSNRPRTRKARLRMTHIDPWSVMKTAFLLSIAMGVVTVIAVAMVWSVLGAAGVWDSINKTVQEVIGGETGTTFNVEDYVGTSRVLGFTMIVAVVDVVLMTAIATLGAFLYNLAATLLGGVEVTLAEEER
jgi:Transmembrane domain of unknown function (DUF3566)